MIENKEKRCEIAILPQLRAPGLLDDGLRLFAQLSLHVAERADRLAGSAPALPAGKGLAIGVESAAELQAGEIEQHRRAEVGAEGEHEYRREYDQSDDRPQFLQGVYVFWHEVTVRGCAVAAGGQAAISF